MSEYRINVRFNLSDTEHTTIIDYLNNLDKEKYKSRNQFIIDAIKSAIAYADRQTADDELLEKFREILKEELCGISVTAPAPSSESFNMELTEDEKQNPFCCTVYFFNNSVKIRNINISKRYS